jgi:hypothetical protein
MVQKSFEGHFGTRATSARQGADIARLHSPTAGPKRE